MKAFLLIFVLFSVGCEKKQSFSNIIDAKVGDVVVDSNNHKYRKLTNESLTNGIGNIDIWEKIEPRVTNKWYTPSLSSRLSTNSVEFNSLYRGEEKP